MARAKRPTTSTTVAAPASDSVRIHVPHKRTVSVLFGGSIRKTYKVTRGVVAVESEYADRFLTAVSGARRVAEPTT